MKIFRFLKNFQLSIWMAILALLFMQLPPIVSASNTNLISNSSVETANSSNASLPQSWKPSNWGTNSTTLSYQDGGHSGNKSLYINMASRTSGDAKWMFDPVVVNPGTAYTYSDYYQSSVDTELDAQYTDNTGKVSFAYLKYVPANTNWAQTTTTFTIPANISNVVVMHIIYSAGWLQTDDFSLVDNSTTTPPQVSVANPSNNSTVNGSQTVSASATDSQGISSVQFKLDGNNLGSAITVSPYQINWDTTASANGNHTITALATNTSGISTTSSVINVNVQNVATPPPLGTNLVANPSVEIAGTSGITPSSWGTNRWGTNTTTFTYQDGGHSGNKSLYINMASRTSGDAKWIFNSVPATPNTTYTFSNYYMSNTSTELDAQFTDTSGNISYAFLKTVPATTNWSQVNASFTTPASTAKVTILHIIYSAGWVQTDDYSLTQNINPTPPQVSLSSPANNTVVSGIQSISANATDAQGISSVQFKLDGNNLGSAITNGPYGYDWDTTKTANGAHTLTAVATNSSGLSTTSPPVSISVQNQTPPSNLIPNPSVEIASATNPNLPQSWNKGSWGTNSTAFTYLNNSGNTGNRSLLIQVNSYTNGAAYWYFQSQPVAPSKQYDLKEYYKSNVIAEVDAVYNLSDGTSQYVNLGNSFPSNTDWTKFERQFTTPANVISMSIRHTIYSTGWLQTDDSSITSYTTVGFNRPIVSLTFDDGWASYYNNGLPVLKKYGLTSTDFIVSGYLGTSGYMTANQIQKLYLAGHEIGSHTVDHSDLTTLTATSLNSELQDSQVTLQALIGAPVTDFASPFGSYNQTVINNLKLYYQSHRGVESGFNAKSNFDYYDIKVQNMYSTTTLAQVQSWIQQAQASNTWLVLVYHKVDPTIAKTADKYNTYTSDLDAQLSYIKSSGIQVETISQALSEISPQL